MKLEVDVQLLQAILNYLQTQPYNEVYLLIPEIVKLTPKQEVKEENTDAK